jgi:hypothetical protein
MKLNDIRYESPVTYYRDGTWLTGTAMGLDGWYVVIALPSGGQIRVYHTMVEPYGTERTNGPTARKQSGRPPQVRACAHCKSTDIEVTIWVHANSGEVTERAGSGDVWCPKCQRRLYGRDIMEVDATDPTERTHSDHLARQRPDVDCPQCQAENA